MPTPAEYDAVHAAAHAAGTAAGQAHDPTPMIVEQHAHPLIDSSPVVQSWRVDAGVCGFAWVWLKGSTGYARRLTSRGLTSNAYPTGKMLWVGGFGQSYERKCAYASAYTAKVLETLPDLRGSIHPDGRLD